MKLLINLLLWSQLGFAKTPIKIYWNTHPLKLEQIHNLVLKHLQTPEKLISHEFKQEPCVMKKETGVLVLCIDNDKLKILHNNSEALNNAYRIFRNRKI